MRIVGDDPLHCDDVRYFTVEVREPRKILLLGQRAGRHALPPRSARARVAGRRCCGRSSSAKPARSPSSTTRRSPTSTPSAWSIRRELPPAAWQSLADYVHAGGGVGIFLGRNAKRDPFNEPAPQQLLPAKLRWQSRDATYLRPAATEHPALRELAELGDAVPWSEFPVFKYWELESPADDVYVLAPFANGQPALVERQRRRRPRDHDDDARLRSGARRSLEPAADRPRSLAVPRAGQRHRRISGRRGRRAAQLPGRPDGDPAARPERASLELRARHARRGPGAAIAHARPAGSVDRVDRSAGQLPRPRRRPAAAGSTAASA